MDEFNQNMRMEIYKMDKALRKFVTGTVDKRAT